MRQEQRQDGNLPPSYERSVPARAARIQVCSAWQTTTMTGKQLVCLYLANNHSSQRKTKWDPRNVMSEIASAADALSDRKTNE